MLRAHHRQKTKSGSFVATITEQETLSEGYFRSKMTTITTVELVKCTQLAGAYI